MKEKKIANKVIGIVSNHEVWFWPSLARRDIYDTDVHIKTNNGTRGPTWVIKWSDVVFRTPYTQTTINTT